MAEKNSNLRLSGSLNTPEDVKLHKDSVDINDMFQRYLVFKISLIQ